MEILKEGTRTGFIESLKKNRPRAAEFVLIGLSVWYALSALESFDSGKDELGIKQLVNSASLAVVAGAIFALEKILKRRNNINSASESPERSNQQSIEPQVFQPVSNEERESSR